jgi:predicted AlkP superfamily pyrophosphatase or phosphodiesterase
MHWSRLAAGLLVFSSLQAQAPRKPKLVVAIVVDQFRYDYLTRFRNEYHGGLDRLLREGAVFTNARYGQAPTVTAVGHSIVMTGAMPAVSGIVGNSWFDRKTGKQVTSVCDYSFHVVGAETQAPGNRCEDWDPASPNRLMVSSIGDELRNREEQSKVFGISLKARSAILPSGHRANGAFWFDDRSGAFVTSDFYSPELPDWVQAFNHLKLAEKYVDTPWTGKGFEPRDFHPDPGSFRPYDKLPASPWGNELLERLAERAIDAEKLGQRDVTDLLTLSLSANDYLGHQTGPDAPEVRAMCILTDQLLEKLFAFVGQKVGMENALFVLSADHGVAPVPEVQQQRKMPGDYIYVDIEDVVRSGLTKKFGAGDYIAGTVDNAVYLNYKTLDDKKADLTAAYRTASAALFAVPQLHIMRVFTKDQLSQGIAGDPLAQAVMNGFHPARSGDIIVLFEPYYMPTQTRPTRTTHFTPYNYDTHVPVIFLGPGVKPGTYRGNILVNDIAPTLAALMDVEPPSGAFGRVLTEMLAGK